jgi:quercetin dioxygenase-like cupin family protein
MPTEPPRRTPLLDVELPAGQVVERVQVTRVELGPGQAAGRHSHPCAVVGHIVSGRIRFQVEGAEEVGLGEGDAFYEPADTPIAHFDNASPDEPAVFVAFYLLPPGEERTIEML